MGERQRVPGGENPGRSVLQVLADHLREVYIYERRTFEERLSGNPSHYQSSPHWDGGESANGRRSNIWLKVADFVLRNHLLGDAFIRRQFQLADGRYVIKPNQLYNQEALERYRRCQPNERREIELAWVSQKNVLIEALTIYQDMAEMEGAEVSTASLQATVLLDEDIALSALFRYCLARSEGLIEIARMFRDAAALQYVRRRDDYDAVWKKWIPDKFKTKAEAIYRRVLVAANGETKGRKHGEGK